MKTITIKLSNKVEKQLIRIVACTRHDTISELVYELICREVTRFEQCIKECKAEFEPIVRK